MTIGLLQISYMHETDPRIAVGILLAALALIGFFIIKNLRNLKPEAAKKDPIDFSSVATGGSSRTVRRIAAKYGLDAVQTEFLSKCLNRIKITNSDALVANPSAIDMFLKKIFIDIEKTAETRNDAEGNKAILFSIRDAIERFGESSDSSTTTALIKKQTAGVLIGPKGEHYPIRIIDSRGDRIVAEAPKDVMGNVIKIRRNADVRLALVADAGRSVNFATRVLGYQKTRESVFVELEHSATIDQHTKRKGRRRDVRLSGSFSVYSPGTKSIPADTATGMIVDISAGGCAVKTIAPLKAGSFLRMDFSDGDGQRLPLLGRIVRTNKSGSGETMHIQFVKIPQKTQNAIDSLIYDYR